MGKANAGEEITGLAKEQASYIGIRVDKSRACRWGSESTLTSKGGASIVLSLYPSRHFLCHHPQRGVPQGSAVEKMEDKDMQGGEVGRTGVQEDRTVSRG